uniref:Jagged canonical Notch ligand 2 n=1 Tax=Macaca mulatta TaxID=9544 RepID=A0A5F7ZKL4_MACMU
MDRIEGASVGRCAASPYLRPLTLHYRQNGAQKSWDFMKTHDSVTVLLFNSSRRSLVLVKQFRPAVYAGEVERHFPGSLAAVDQDRPRELQPALPGSAGVTVELCAGLVDQPGLSLEEVACKEAWEECGYHLAPSDLRRVATYCAPSPSSWRPGTGTTIPPRMVSEPWARWQRLSASGHLWQGPCSLPAWDKAFLYSEDHVCCFPFCSGCQEALPRLGFAELCMPSLPQS